MVHVNRGEHAHLVALLGVQLLRDGLERLGQGLGIHVDGARLGLVARGDGGRGGGGVGAERRGIVGGHAAHMREAHEGKGALDNGAVVFGRTLEIAGNLNLLVAHAVADEQEDVLRRGSSGLVGESGGRTSNEAGSTGKGSSLDEVTAVHSKVHVVLSPLFAPTAHPRHLRQNQELLRQGVRG